MAALSRLHQTWWPARSDRARRDALLADYAHYCLFARSRRGDEDAATRFHAYWMTAVRRFLRRGFTVEQVEELGSAFFERVYARVSDFAWSSPFTVYLQAILVNLFRDEVRRLTRSRARGELTATGEREATLERLPARSPEPGPEQTAIRQQQLRAVHRAMAGLAPADRHIIRHLLVDEGSYEELQEVLGLSRNALHQRLFRAKKRLRKLVARETDL